MTGSQAALESTFGKGDCSSSDVTGKADELQAHRAISMAREDPFSNNQGCLLWCPQLNFFTEIVTKKNSACAVSRHANSCQVRCDRVAGIDQPLRWMSPIDRPEKNCNRSQKIKL